MVFVYAKCTVQAGKVDDYLALARELVRETRLETGCISYDLAKLTDDPQVFAFVEKWESEADLDRHSNSAHFTALIPQIAELSEIQIFSHTMVT